METMTGLNACRGNLILVLVVWVVLAGCQSSPPSDAYIEGLRERSEKGSVAAQVRMGSLYWLGKGVPEDYQEAVKWFRKAAEQEHARGQEALGRICYAAVLMRRQDEVKELLSRLAGEESYRHPEAEWADCDLVEAYAWLSLAVAQGQQTAEEKRANVRDYMTAAEIAQAQELASDLHNRIEASKSE